MANGHGGARNTSGRKRKPLSEAILDGTRKSRLKITKFEGVDLVDETTPTIPEINEHLKAVQKDGEVLLAEMFFNRIYLWLVARKCEKLIEDDYLQRFAMQQAVYWQVIPENVVKRVMPPKVARTEAKYLDEKQTAKLIELLINAPHQYRTMILLFIYSGLRRGELCGLEWKDINFENNMLSIVRSSQYLPRIGIFTKEPKTESSKRAIKLSNSAILMLKEFKRWQLGQRLKMGDNWIDTDRIFTKVNGNPIHPDTISGWFRDFVKRNNLPNICVHSLRHTNITLLISAGIPIPTVSKRAGHSNPSVTTMIYSHAIKSLDERAAEALDEIVMGV